LSLTCVSIGARAVKKNMTEAIEARIIRYRETVAALRRQTERLRSDNAAITQLLDLADGWEQLVDSVETEQRRLR
jgi:hypothetical protein